ncbi:amidohydrolase family protein [Pseudohaliea sp.]|uniref:amidohydrolase family protein n=1 Tax=Pseudohaliea sp. TaxID=2740289 RepID=UPI0032EC07C2
MKRVRIIYCFVIFFFIPFDARAGSVVLSNVNVIDVVIGRVQEQQDIFILDGEIQKITDHGTSMQKRDAIAPEEIIDYSGKFIIPGLWDMHVHPETARDLELMVLNGVLGARSLMGEPVHLKWRADIELGKRLGPRLFLAGPIVEGHPPPGMEGLMTTKGRRLISTKEEGVKEARAQFQAGFDYLKVYNNLPVPAYRGLIEEGRRLGIPVLGHIPIEVGLENALAWGQIGVEHLRGSIQLLVQNDAPVQPGKDLRSRMLAWQYIDEARMSELAKLNASFDVYHCPTVVARLFFSPSARVQAYLARPESLFIQPRWRDILKDRAGTPWLSNFSEEDFEFAATGFEMMDAYIRALHEAGVPLLAGTDMGPWGFSLHDELIGLVEAGLSIPDVLRTATLNPARFSGVEAELGVVSQGFRADLVILDANPLTDISNTRKIHAVIQGGRIMNRAELDERLEALESTQRR